MGSRGRWELGAKLGDFEWGGGGPMYAIVYPAWGPSPGPRALGPGPSPRPRAPGWVNYSIHGAPTPPTPNPRIWPRTALGPISANRGHRGESIPPIHIQKCCNRTDLWQKNGLAHVCSSLPRPRGSYPGFPHGKRRPGPSQGGLLGGSQDLLQP